jgi:IS5 family transposase
MNKKTKQTLLLIDNEDCIILNMKIFESLKLKFEQPDWASNPQFAVFDTILEMNPSIIEMVAADIIANDEKSKFGRRDTPSVEQIVRAAIYKEINNYTYRELAYAQTDSRICEHFVKINPARPYSFQVLQKYISRIKEDTLEKLMVEMNKIAIEEDIETLEKFREDSTVVETNIHYPTNNTILFDCIKESHRLLKHLKEEINNLKYTNYQQKGKKRCFKIDVEKSKEKRKTLFKEQLKLFTKCTKQVSDVIDQNLESSENIRVIGIIEALKLLLPIMGKVNEMTYDREILGKQVPNDEKIFSIYEQHTDIIVKGQKKCKFGHKVDLGTGASNLILTCSIPRGNPNDKEFFCNTIDTIKRDYGKAPKSVVTDGGYASKNNQKHAAGEGVINVVFNKITTSMKNIVESPSLEKELMRWRSGMEAVISNLKRGYKLVRCNWKGWMHFQRKVYWSIIAYNIRVLTGHMLAKLTV